MKPTVKDHWEIELERCNKSGLIHLAKSLMRPLFRGDRALLLWEAKEARTHGAFIDAMAAAERWRDDPDRELERRLQRQLSATRAARRRKKAKR